MIAAPIDITGLELCCKLLPAMPSLVTVVPEGAVVDRVSSGTKLVEKGFPSELVVAVDEELPLCEVKLVEVLDPEEVVPPHAKEQACSEQQLET